MSIGVSTWCRAADESPAAFTRRLADLGAAGLLLDTRLPGPWVEALHAARRGLDLPIWAVEAPCPRPRTSRDPQLGSRDKEERRAAQGQVEDAIRLAGEVGASTVIVRLGQLPGVDDTEWQELVHALRLGRDKGQARRLQRRLALAPQVLDQARFALEPLLARAEAAGVTLALVSRARWYELPDAAEVAVLCEDFRGAPLAACYDAGAAHVLAAQGGPEEGAFLTALGTRVVATLRTDAAGLRGGLPWRLGEAAHTLPNPATPFVHCAPGARPHELARALAP